MVSPEIEKQIKKLPHVIGVKYIKSPPNSFFGGYNGVAVYFDKRPSLIKIQKENPLPVKRAALKKGISKKYESVLDWISKSVDEFDESVCDAVISEVQKIKKEIKNREIIKDSNFFHPNSNLSDERKLQIIKWVENLRAEEKEFIYILLRECKNKILLPR
jgi:hypothetical protein